MLFKKDNYRYLDYVICRRRNKRKKLLKIIILLIDFKIETHAKRRKKIRGIRVILWIELSS